MIPRPWARSLSRVATTRPRSCCQLPSASRPARCPQRGPSTPSELMREHWVGLASFPKLRTLRARLAAIAKAIDPLALQVAFAKAMLSAVGHPMNRYFVDDHFVLPYHLRHTELLKLWDHTTIYSNLTRGWVYGPIGARMPDQPLPPVPSLREFISVDRT